MAYFHPSGLVCPHCAAALKDARKFRVTHSSQVPDYRCRECQKTYNVYSRTVFEGRRLMPEQVVLLVRGMVKGEQAQILANEVGVCRQTVQAIREQLQVNAQRMQPENPLESDTHTETDEMYQDAGKKVSQTSTRLTHPDGTPINNGGMVPIRMTDLRIVGTVARDSGQVRLRMVEHCDEPTLCEHVEHFTTSDTHVYTDEWRPYNRVDRTHATVCHDGGFCITPRKG